jgi:hypothetical protein
MADLHNRRNRSATATLIVMLLMTLGTAPSWSAATCSAQSTANAAPVIELYTSEGCSSCPPADRWLSRLKDDPGVVALAFHVDYWDRLGWKDRFASPAYTQRQAQQQRSNGARFSYTPQVVVDGVDRPRWYSTDPPGATRTRAAALVDIQLTRDGRQFAATVQARPGAPPRLAGYWALTESGHSTAVKAGENEGATLLHDFVVQRYLQIAPWNATAGATVALRFGVEPAVDAAHPRSVNLVVTDAATGRPVQALKLGC